MLEKKLNLDFASAKYNSSNSAWSAFYLPQLSQFSQPWIIPQPLIGFLESRLPLIDVISKSTKQVVKKFTFLFFLSPLSSPNCVQWIFLWNHLCDSGCISKPHPPHFQQKCHWALSSLCRNLFFLHLTHWLSFLPSVKGASNATSSLSGSWPLPSPRCMLWGLTSCHISLTLDE